MAVTIRHESRSAALSLSAAVRREPDGAYWDFAGSWSDQAATTPLTATPSGAGTTLYAAASAAAISEDGLYAVEFRDASGAVLYERYASVLGGTDGAPAAPQERPSELADILLAVRRRLVEEGVFSDRQVDLALADEPDPAPVEGAVFGRVCPLDCPGGPMADGGGRHVTDVQAPILVRVYARKAGDRVHLARRALAYNGGLLRRANRVVDALQQFAPVDAAANVIVAEPLRLAASARPVRYAADATWYRADIQFSTSYRERFVDENTTF